LSHIGINLFEQLTCNQHALPTIAIP